MSNRLAGETSPYLLQHADNPVDWYPWGDEALALARREARPILLSIGYSACHWCHVMAHESFEDERVAAVMNAHFVNIKVDREERPDLDKVYQTAHRAAHAPLGRLAADDVSHAVRRAVLRGHLLPEGKPLRRCRFRRPAAAHRGCIPRAGRSDRRAERTARRCAFVAGAAAGGQRQCPVAAQCAGDGARRPRTDVRSRSTADSAGRRSSRIRRSSRSAFVAGRATATKTRSASSRRR